MTAAPHRYQEETDRLALTTRAVSARVRWKGVPSENKVVARQLTLRRVESKEDRDRLSRRAPRLRRYLSTLLRANACTDALTRSLRHCFWQGSPPPHNGTPGMHAATSNGFQNLGKSSFLFALSTRSPESQRNRRSREWTGAYR